MDLRESLQNVSEGGMKAHHSDPSVMELQVAPALVPGNTIVPVSKASRCMTGSTASAT